ncbi:MAG: signal peptidase I [Oscillospiraceae bacterium]|nr:signal peptidase I [Oscillospiraceae bacterium]
MGNTRKKSLLYDIYEWVETLFLPFVFIVLIMTFTARVSRVDGRSMEPTLHDNDYLIISNLFYEPDYNDIIVLQAVSLHNEMFETGKPIVKRVVGLPGDRIYVDSIGGIVYRNNQPLETVERGGVIYEDGHMINDYTFSGELEVVVVPEDSVYVLGDNRMNSLDSRSPTVGTVNKNYIVGKAIYRILPFSYLGDLY